VHGLERLTATGETVGTPAYMAPELFTGGGAPIDHRIDIYALGVIAFEALAGVPPFDARHPGRLVFAIARGDARRLDEDHEVSPTVANVVHRAMSIDPAQRYGTMEELARAFADAVNPRRAEGGP
jgi:serine/threonine-protein kinase